MTWSTVSPQCWRVRLSLVKDFPMVGSLLPQPALFRLQPSAGKKFCACALLRHLRPTRPRVATRRDLPTTGKIAKRPTRPRAAIRYPSLYPDSYPIGSHGVRRALTASMSIYWIETANKLTHYSVTMTLTQQRLQYQSIRLNAQDWRELGRDLTNSRPELRDPNWTP